MLRSLLLKTGPGDQTPTEVALGSNQPSMHFNDVSDKAPIQEFDVPLDRNVADYTPGQQSLATFLRQLSSSASQGVDTTRIYYVGLFGHWTEYKSDQVITVYETQANLADHKKMKSVQVNMQV